MRLILYTQRYREGGPQLRRAAETLASERQAAGPVRLVCVDSKRAFVDAVQGSGPLVELHFVGHSGLYGPMFGSKGLPEQFSPHEWRTLPIPFVEGGEAWFHACRTGRWFAPFFARTFAVPTWGHHGYTTFSRAPDRYLHAPAKHRGPLYVVGQPGFQEEGVVGAVGKHLGLRPPRPMGRHLPAAVDGSYDRVAALYDAAFEDIRVRDPEWRWLSARVPDGSHVLDVGCGTGGLLRALGPRIGGGLGVDTSEAMVGHARRRGGEGLRFEAVDGPVIPAPADHFDVVTSLLSWRYLDWDPLLLELLRVLKPGGRLLVVDMVARPASVREWPVVAAHGLRASRVRRRFPRFAAARDALVSDRAWGEMLRHNPIRAPHELEGFFRSRFPAAEVELLDVGRRTAVMAVDTGPVAVDWVPPQSYP
jgi:SAM-dependent methyltransferase